jgi:hypothetical protein
MIMNHQLQIILATRKRINAAKVAFCIFHQ